MGWGGGGGGCPAHCCVFLLFDHSDESKLAINEINIQELLGCAGISISYVKLRVPFELAILVYTSNVYGTSKILYFILISKKFYDTLALNKKYW